MRFDCDTAHRELSVRLDQPDPERDAALEIHLKSCAACRRYEDRLRSVRRALRVGPAEDVPNLVPAIMDRVRDEGLTVRRRDEHRSFLRTAIAAAAVAALVLGGVVAPWRDNSSSVARADEIVTRVQDAARSLDSYAATYRVVERGWHDKVHLREFQARVWYEAPERFRMSIRDLTPYPGAGTWPRNDVEIVATPSAYRIEEPISCPVEAMPSCAASPRRTVRSIVHRQPFDGTTMVPTDIIVPLQTLADADAFVVVGRESVGARTAYHRGALPARGSPRKRSTDRGVVATLPSARSRRSLDRCRDVVSSSLQGDRGAIGRAQAVGGEQLGPRPARDRDSECGGAIVVRDDRVSEQSLCGAALQTCRRWLFSGRELQCAGQRKRSRKRPRAETLPGRDHR
jgi:anti-sigma factor RsiW